MEWYYYIILLMLASQFVSVLEAYSNYSFAVKKYNKNRSYRPRTVVIIPCKGTDAAFEKNITSFFEQDYDNYLLWFVVSDESDPAYSLLCRLKELLHNETKAIDVQIFVAGPAGNCGQKNHNLVYCSERIGSDIDVLAVADSDICVGPNWLSHLVHPLRKSKYGVTSGYRWFVPQKNNSATLALSALNAKVAQLLGNSPFNQVWGGSMAIRTDVFRRVGIDKIWSQTLSDDLTLARAVRRAGLKVAFIPACLVASYESTTWPKLYEFARRQFFITRICSPLTWWFGLLSLLLSVLGLWGGVALAALFHPSFFLFRFLVVAMPVTFFAVQIIRAFYRQKMIFKLLEKDRDAMRTARMADIVFSWCGSALTLFFILSSAFGREIRWRGIKYRLSGPTKIEVIGSPAEQPLSISGKK
jgi:ceramide glucosyltransferase